MESKKKIIIVGPLPPPYNGMSVATQTILDSSLREKFNIIHLDISDRRDIKNIGFLDWTNVYLALKHSFKLFLLLALGRPDLVYIPIAQNNLGYLRDAQFLIWAKLFRRKRIVHLHGGYFKEFYKETNFLMSSLIKYTLKGVGCAIVLGECLRDNFSIFFPSEKIKVVPNGIDEEIFVKDKTKREIRDFFSMFYLGALTEGKGMLDILKAIPEVIEKVKKVKFVFGGIWRGDAREKAEEIIERYGLGPFVFFPGEVSGKVKANLFLKSDIFVFPTHYRYEGHPLVILEAMGAELPVVTTDKGAIKETVIDGENGFIIDKKNPQQIAEKIILLIENENLRREMGRKSRERFLKYYTKDKFINNLSRVFEEVLSV